MRLIRRIFLNQSHFHILGDVCQIVIRRFLVDAVRKWWYDEDRNGIEV